MFLDHFPGNRPRRRARSHQPQKFPPGIFRGAQRDPRRTKRRVSLQIPCRRFLNIPIFPAANSGPKTRRLTKDIVELKIPRGRKISGGRSPGNWRFHLQGNNRYLPRPTPEVAIGKNYGSQMGPKRSLGVVAWGRCGRPEITSGRPKARKSG